MKRSIPAFSLPELETALKGMANLRSADEEGIVVEMIKHINIHFKEHLLTYLSRGLHDRNFDESLYIAILQMIPKD